MKQEITKEEYAKLPMATRQRWHEWSFERGYPPRPNIGRMAEFIEDSLVNIGRDPKTKRYLVHFYQPEYNYTRTKISKELCDALWEVVKAVLEA